MGEEVAAIKDTHKTPIIAVCYSSNGLFFASASSDGMVCLWNSANHTDCTILNVDSRVNCIAISRDSSFLFAGADNGKLYCWRTDDPGRP